MKGIKNVLNGGKKRRISETLVSFHFQGSSNNFGIYVDSMFELGQLYASGIIVGKDKVVAAGYLRQCADQGFEIPGQEWIWAVRRKSLR